MTHHLLAYYRWDQRTHWKLDSMDRGGRGEPVLAYVSYDRGLFPKYAVRDSVLWVIGLGPDQCPTLEARLQIQHRIETREGGQVGITVEGTPDGSDFFGLNDVSEAVMKLVFASERGNWSLRERQGSTVWIPAHGKHLRAPRRIAPAGERTASSYPSPGIQPLVDLAENALGRSIFVSWKHCDHGADQQEFLRELTVALSKRGFSVWMDQLALGDAREVAERTDREEAMRKLLAQGLRRCHIVLGVWTDWYGAPSEIDGVNWTRNEWEGPKGTKRVALLPDREYRAKKGMREPDRLVRIPAAPAPADAERIAGEVQRECRELL